MFKRERERNVLFNDALNTFYLRLYGVRHMVKYHSDSERGNPLPPHLIDEQQGFFYMHHPTDIPRPVVEHWLEREISQWVHPMKDRSDDPSHHERTFNLWATSRSRVCLRLNSLFVKCNFLVEYIIHVYKLKTQYNIGVCAGMRGRVDSLIR